MEDPHAKFYNSLPLIDDAHRLFKSRHKIIQDLRRCFREFDPEGKFGVCLVRRHGILPDGRLMVTDGQVTRPQIRAAGVNDHPMRWHRTGEAFEFSQQCTGSPCADFLSKFREIVDTHEEGLAVLGIFFVPEEERNRVRHGFEHIREGKNITRYEEVVITSWRLSADLADPDCKAGCTCCSNSNHVKSLNFSFTSPHANNVFSPNEPETSDKPLTRTILDLTSKTLTAMQHCASLLPCMCVLVTHLDDCCVRWAQTRLDVPVDAIYMTDTTGLLESLKGTSTTIDDLHLDIVSVASTLERCQSDRVHFRGTEEMAIVSQLHILDAQLALLSKQVSAVGSQMDRLPDVDPAATRLREWAAQFAMASNLVHSLEGVVTSVVGISSGLVASLKDDTDLSAN